MALLLRLSGIFISGRLFYGPGISWRLILYLGYLQLVYYSYVICAQFAPFYFGKSRHKKHAILQRIRNAERNTELRKLIGINQAHYRSTLTLI